MLAKGLKVPRSHRRPWSGRASDLERSRVVGVSVGGRADGCPAVGEGWGSGDGTGALSTPGSRANGASGLSNVLIRTLIEPSRLSTFSLVMATDDFSAPTGLWVPETVSCLVRLYFGSRG